MSKYIDIRKLKIPKGTVTDVKLRGVPAIVELLEKQPTVDAVEVVRCKDCKHLIEIDPDNLYVCARIDIGMDGEPSFLSPENDYCSRGERREAKDNE